MWCVTVHHPMTDDRCLRCGSAFDYDDGECPDCEWSAADFRESDRYGLARAGTGEWGGD